MIGVAIYIGPEPCVGVREDGDEASVGEGIGQPLSRESQSPGADAVSSAEGNTFRTRHRKVRTTRRGRRTWHVQTLFARKPGDLAIDLSATAAGGRREGTAANRAESKRHLRLRVLYAPPRSQVSTSQYPNTALIDPILTTLDH